MDEDTAGAADVLTLPQAPDAIELRHLRAFVAVADELNFGRAAARLYLSQPALSRQIRALERLVGCDLLRRSTHRVELTLAGEALLDRARPLLRGLDEAITVTRSVGGELMARIARHWEAFAEVSMSDLQELRTAYEDLHSQFEPPPHIGVRPANAGGVPALLLSKQPADDVTLLFLHGGGYITGSAFGYRPLAAAIADAAGTGVVVPDYRLAPEFPFPAAIEDAVRTYRWLLDRGVPAAKITVAGDSAGGGLAVSLLLSLRDQKIPLPAGAMLLCPGVDLTRREDSAHEISEFRHAAASLFLAGHPADDPLICPRLADLTGMPPLLVQAATGDPLLTEARELVDHATECGVDARFELFPVDTHDFQIFWSFLPEAAQALRQAARFAQDVVASRKILDA
ncbi:MAG TPA: alpha/beta hydrolase fold domain-containing protein [Streptosporangiaceae bacterium]